MVSAIASPKYTIKTQHTNNSAPTQLAININAHGWRRCISSSVAIYPSVNGQATIAPVASAAVDSGDELGSLEINCRLETTRLEDLCHGGLRQRMSEDGYIYLPGLIPAQDLLPITLAIESRLSEASWPPRLIKKNVIDGGSRPVQWCKSDLGLSRS